jgi:hypothetical protein
MKRLLPILSFITWAIASPLHTERRLNVVRHGKNQPILGVSAAASYYFVPEINYGFEALVYQGVCAKFTQQQ